MDTFRKKDPDEEEIDRILNEFVTKPEAREVMAKLATETADEVAPDAAQPTTEAAAPDAPAEKETETPPPVAASGIAEAEEISAKDAATAEKAPAAITEEAPAVAVPEAMLVTEDTATLEEPAEEMIPATEEAGVILPGAPETAELVTEEALAGDASPAAAPEKVSVKKATGNLLDGVIPKWGDRPMEVVRKCVFMLAVLVLIGSACYLLNDMCFQPIQAESEASEIRGMYTPGTIPQLTADEGNFTYPDGILPEFKKLYYQNQDLRGWLTFKSTGKTDLFDNYIDYPVLQAKDNSYYLTHNFQNTQSKNGTLFFDYRNVIKPDMQNKNLIVYGHNLSSGQMFTRLNRLITVNKNYARSAPTVTVSTLYDKSVYKVFAVMVVNTKESDGAIFKYWRTGFKDNDDFLDFVKNIRARSLYDYNDVSVEADDQLLMLSTCNGKSQVHFDDGRTVVVARKVRDGESTAVNTAKTELNGDVLMPEAWYRNQKKDVPAYYATGILPGESAQ